MNKEYIDDLKKQHGIDVVALVEETLIEDLNLATQKELEKIQKAEKQKMRKNKLNRL
jgi:hypothetical protein